MMANVMEWVWAFRCARAPVVVILLANLALLLPAQTRDMLNAFDTKTVLAFNGTLALMALSGWFWSRTLLAARCRIVDDEASRAQLPSRRRAAFDWTPRLIFLLSVLLGCGITLRSGAWLEFAIILVWALTLTLFLTYRQSLMRDLGGLFGFAPKRRLLPRSLSFIGRCRSRFLPRALITPLLQLIIYAPLSGWITVGALAFGLLLFVLGLCYGVIGFINLPLWASYWLPGPASGLMALALMIGPFSYLTRAADRLHHLYRWRKKRRQPGYNGWLMLFDHPPVMIVVMLWLCVSWSLFNLHNIRVVDSAGSLNPSDRPALRDAFLAWAKSCDLHPQILHPVIVAISGGASRAGLWGLRVLASVDAAIPAGQPRIFAISSVSGGSLGAAAFLTTLASRQKGRPCASSPYSEALVEREGQAIGGDSLGPALAGLFMVDLPHQLLPISDNARGSDRAAALEHAFERLWLTSGQWSPGAPSFSSPYLSLTLDPATKKPRPTIPLWFTNGTDVSSGLRLITAPINPDAGWPFDSSEDALGQLGADVPISTAINNSARFPVLEPAGALAPVTRAPGGAPAARILDGGYFNNSGLMSAVELAHWLQTVGRDALESAEQRKVAVNPVIVYADADGEALQAEQIIRCPAQASTPLMPISGLAWEDAAPIIATFNLRMGHGETSLMQTRREFCGNLVTSPQDGAAAHFFHLYLAANGTTEIPLDWVLSRPMKSYILHTAMGRAGNSQEILAFRASLQPPTQACASAPK